MGQKAFKSAIRAKGHFSAQTQNERYFRERIKALEANIRYFEGLAGTEQVGEDGVSPYQPVLAELYSEVSDLEFALACPAAAN